MKIRIALFALAILFAACAPPAEPPPDVNAVRAAIEAVNAQFMEAFNKGDAAAVAALYSEDAIVLPPGQTMTSGRQAIQEGTAADIANYSLSGLKLTTSDVQVSGDYAVEVGNYSIQAGAVQDEGKYLVVWKKGADGSWKLYRDAWNSNTMPAGGDEPTGDEQEQ